jgi:phosphate starvation-inducible PhoH-like protein
MATKSALNRNRKNSDVYDTSQITDKDKIFTVLRQKINVKTKNDSQKNLIKLIKSKEIVIVAGSAGTGKTFLSLATALDLLIDKTTPYTNIHLIKSVTTLPNEELGFIKGDLKEKLEMPMLSFMMNINKLVSETAIFKLIEMGVIKHTPLAYIRGLSIDNSIIILDETQNVTIDTLRTLMTRIGENSKLILLGDTKQVDLRQKDKSALKTAMKIFKDVEEIGTMEFTSEDIVRNPLIKIIEEKFNLLDSGK